MPTDKEKLTIVVTGGAGFIGSTLVEHFLRLGHAVRVLDDFSSGSVHAIRACYNYANFYCIKGNVTDLPTVEGIVAGADVVFHLAAQVHVEESILDPRASFDVNSTGTLNVLEAARRSRPQFILYASSTEVYGNAQRTPMDESHPFGPQSPYAAGKAAADRLCAAYHATYQTPVVILRQFNTYGPRQRFKGYSAVIPIFAARLLKGRPPVIFGDGHQARDFHYIDDSVRAYDLLMAGYEPLLGRAINFGTGVETSINELAATMIELAADEWKRPELRSIEPVDAAGRPGEVKKFAADITLAKKALHFEPNVPLREGSKSTCVGSLRSIRTSSTFTERSLQHYNPKRLNVHDPTVETVDRGTRAACHSRGARFWDARTGVPRRRVGNSVCVTVWSSTRNRCRKRDGRAAPRPSFTRDSGPAMKSSRARSPSSRR